jgi:hypothetical protein
MDKRELGKAYGFDDQHTRDKEAIASPPPTITRRSGKNTTVADTSTY